MEFKASVLPPAGRLQSNSSHKWFCLAGKKKKKTLENDFIWTKISLVLCFNIPATSKRTAIDLDICSFEISFFH